MWGSNRYNKKVFLLEMTTVILGVLSFSRLSLNVINIVVVVNSR